ncbi:uncharacterized protein LOC122497755 [Leptopilina heterotoma]|uniref:uncharacterized protein LOC122497755 n=1 Tax=Leptopilina heterotoma TaxID=63436 RepID=UPI001CAA353E|nr:uncharacterized protein LOC122497755 [Leptopilina heterotoma]
MNFKKATHPRKFKKSIEEKEILPPPRVISHELYFPRFGTKKDVTPPSPFILIDGKLLRSSISFCKKKNNRRVKFPENDILVSAYFESVNSWDYILDGEKNSEEDSEESDVSDESEDSKSENSSDGSICGKIEGDQENGQRSVS